MCKLKMFLLQHVMLAEVATLLFSGYGFLRRKVSKVGLLTHQHYTCLLYILIVYNLGALW